MTTKHVSDANFIAYADESLPDAVRREVETHVAECADCRARLQDVLETVAMVKRAPRAEFRESLRQTMHRHIQGGGQVVPLPAPRRRRWNRWTRLASVAAVILVALGGLAAIGVLRAPVPIMMFTDGERQVVTASFTMLTDDVESFIRMAEANASAFKVEVASDSTDDGQRAGMTVTGTLGNASGYLTWLRSHAAAGDDIELSGESFFEAQIELTVRSYADGDLED